jgi:hypothetical protein
MDHHDDGFFHYNDQYPPLCIVQPPMIERPSMEGVIGSYLQESYKDGLKHSETILPSGLTAGEAAVLYFRDLNDKNSDSSNLDFKKIKTDIANSIFLNMAIDCSKYQKEFDAHITESIFGTPQSKNKLIAAIKCFLKSTHQKKKGYTRCLSKVLSDISSSFDAIVK